MKPEDALNDLLARVGATEGAAVFVSAEELTQWPAAAVAAMKAQKLLAKARPAASVVCPGCERECVMPVQTLTRTSGAASSFVVCDKRDDINRVAISSDLLKQWRCNAEAVCGFVAKSLGLHRSDQRSANASVWNIGIARGDKRSQMLGLRADGDLALVAGSNAVPLAEVVGYGDGEYSVDGAMIRRMVDSVTTADARYTPSKARRETGKLNTQAMYGGWQKAYRDLKKQRRNMSDVWYSRQVAKLDIAAGRNAETIRKHMKSKRVG
jgi:hypothetical protein